MYPPAGKSLNLKGLIKAVSASPPDKQAETELIFLCRSMAVVLIRKRASVGRLDLGMFGVSAEDLALDCIADLFQRDDDGRLMQIIAYWESIPTECCTDEELLSHLRRLVFARVNQSLFTLYNEVDPSLGKILRNIKLAVGSLRNFQLVDRLGERYLTPALSDTQEHLPPMDREELASTVSEAAQGSKNVPEVLAKLGRHLREQHEFSRLIPLTSLALAIRSLFAPGPGIGVSRSAPEDRFSASDAEKVIGAVCTELSSSMRSQYVEKKKIDPVVYARYFEIIRAYVVERLVRGEDALQPLYDRLSAVVPGLSKEEYKAAHKSRLEYLEKLVYDRVVDELRKGM